jgi:hypothetical protein
MGKDFPLIIVLSLTLTLTRTVRSNAKQKYRRFRRKGTVFEI